MSWGGQSGSAQGYYGGPPPNGPPPSHSPQPGYGPPGHGPPQQGYGQYPPQQGGYGGPPPFQGGYGPPPGPPPHHQGGYNQGPPPPHQGGYNQGPPPPHGGYPPQQGGWGGPPPGQFQGGPQGFGGPPMGMPSPPSPGYDLRATIPGYGSAQANGIRKAMKGFGTNEKALIDLLSGPDPVQMNSIRHQYATGVRRDLDADITSETSSYFREGLLALARGPLRQDVENLYKAIKGLGTKESVLNDVLIGRSNADMRAIKQLYHEIHRHTLEADVRGDLSLKTEQLFDIVMAANRAEESSHADPQDVKRDVSELHRAMRTDQITVCSILALRSDAQLRTIAQNFHQSYGVSLSKAIDDNFLGHMRSALMLMVARATDRARSDAEQLEDSMKGAGTKDDLLVNRVVRCHWNETHKEHVKTAYQQMYHKDLIKRIEGETSGDEERLLVACMKRMKRE